MAGKKKNTGLGRGLDALFADIETIENIEKPTAEDSKAAGVETIDINNIKPNANQPRKTFDPEAIEDLKNSIIEHGIIQPIIVRPVKNGYEIVAGERRYRAAREAKLLKVPCIVRELSDEENMLFAVIENMQREDLNPIEEAEGINSLMNTYGLTQEQVSKSVGKSRPYITNALRILNLPSVVRDMIAAGQLSTGHGKVLLSCKDEKKQIALANKTLKNGLSVRALEALVDDKKPKKTAKKEKNPDVVSVENELKAVFGTKVNLVEQGKKGKIEIEYYSREELDRLIELLRTL